ncbi:transcriptional regulator [Actinophytocola oryzae]|nr:transcriptional regulator [Actinophytocola oryzae]
MHSQPAWEAVRSHLRAHRYELAAGFPPGLAGTPLLSRPAWVPPEPVPLSSVRISFTQAPPWDLPPASGDPAYPSYSAAMTAMDAPTVFENRPTWRLLDADLAGTASLVFGDGRYFDSIDTGEAAAHEYASALLAGTPTPLRDAVGDPTDLRGRPANLAVSALTRRGDDQFLLHWRDPAKVGHAGGLYQVVPVGVFQSSGPGDFDLWRFLLREYAEELLGEPEVTAPDYGTWPFAVAMTEALADGSVTADVLGLGVDPLTFATDLLVRVVVETAVFDEIFGSRVAVNDEGAVSMRPFTQDSIEGLPMQAAGAALVRLALAAGPAR